MKKPAVVSARTNLSFKIPPAQRALLNNLTEGSLVIDRQRRVVLLNRAGERLLGLKNSKITGGKYVDVIGAAKRSDGKLILLKDRPLFSALTREKPVKDRIISYHRQDGATIWLKVNAAPYKNEAGKIVGAIGTFTDVSFQLQAEAQLQESEERFRSLYEYMPTGAIIQKADGEVLAVNPSALKILGVMEDHLRNTDTIDANFRFIREDGTVYPAKEHPSMTAIKTGKAVMNDVMGFYSENDKDYRWIYVNAIPQIKPGETKPFQVMVTFDEFTARKRAEEALKESTDKFQSIFEKSNDAILLTIPDGRILSANNAACRMFGMTEKEIIKAGRNGLLDTTDPRLAPALQKRERTGEFMGELTLIRKNGSKFEGEISTKVYIDSHGDPRTTMIIRDISERKRIEKTFADSEVRYRRLFEAAKDGILILDANTGTIIDVNPFLTEMMDLPEEAFLGKQLWELGFFKDIIANKENLEELQQKKYIRYEDLPLKTASGRQFDVEFISNVYDVDHTRIIQCNIRDITERKKTETLLRQTKQLLQDTELIGKTGGWEYNIDTKQQIWTEGIYRIHETDRSFQPNVENGINFYTEASRSIIQELVRKTEEFGEPFDIELQITTAKGNLRDVRSIGFRDLENRRVFGFFQDITERKQAEEALRKTDENFRNSIANSPMGIQIVNVNGDIIYANRRMVELFGYNTVEEMKAVPYEQRITPETRQAFLKRREQRRQGKEPLNFDITIIRKDSGQRQIRVYGSRVLWDKDLLYQWVYEDVTELIEAEEALRKSERNFRNTMDTSPFGIRIVSDAGETLYANRAILDFYGFKDIEEFLATPTQKRYTPESYAEHVIRKAKRNRGEPMDSEYTVSIVTTSGQIKHLRVFRKEVLWDGKKQYQVLYQDYTLRVEALRNLERSQQRFRDLADMLPQTVWETDINGDFTYSNAEAKRSLRVDINNIRRTNFLDTVAPEDRERARFNFRRVMAGETLNDIEYSNIREDGTKFPVLIYAAPIIIDNKITGMRGISVDITERKRMQVQMIATDRLASIGELASGVAHELNNPLTSIIGFSELLLNRELPDDIKEDVSLIHREAERTATIVRNLLTFARRRKEERRLTDINAIIRLVLDMRQHEHTVRNIQVITGLTDNLPPILVDDFQIQQVFFNIVINAEYFMTEAHGKGVLDMITRRHGDYLRIIIKDDGAGISPEAIDHIFDPFFTTKEVGKGTGLGLSICHGIITSHQGHIRVESEPGKGTEFTIDLPLIVTENTARKDYIED